MASISGYSSASTPTLFVFSAFTRMARPRSSTLMWWYCLGNIQEILGKIPCHRMSLAPYRYFKMVTVRIAVKERKEINSHVRSLYNRWTEERQSLEPDSSKLFLNDGLQADQINARCLISANRAEPREVPKSRGEKGRRENSTKKSHFTPAFLQTRAKPMR